MQKFATLDFPGWERDATKAQIAGKTGWKRYHFIFMHKPRYGCQRATFATGYSRSAWFLRLVNS
jgi:hypothetical protein